MAGQVEEVIPSCVADASEHLLDIFTGKGFPASAAGQEASVPIKMPATGRDCPPGRRCASSELTYRSRLSPEEIQTEGTVDYLRFAGRTLTDSHWRRPTGGWCKLGGAGGARFTATPFAGSFRGGNLPLHQVAAARLHRRRSSRRFRLPPSQNATDTFATGIRSSTSTSFDSGSA